MQPAESCAGDGAARLFRQWQLWRRSAQSVTRAWNDWSAAGADKRPELYDSYISALDAEERAAGALQRMIDPGAGSTQREIRQRRPPSARRASR